MINKNVKREGNEELQKIIESEFTEIEDSQTNQVSSLFLLSNDQKKRLYKVNSYNKLPEIEEHINLCKCKSLNDF